MREFALGFLIFQIVTYGPGSLNRLMSRLRVDISVGLGLRTSIGLCHVTDYTCGCDQDICRPPHSGLVCGGKVEAISA